MQEVEFRRQVAAEGYGEVRLVEWRPNTVNDTHSHDFDARILVLEGEMTVTKEDESIICRAGDSNALAAGTPHAERIGPQGVRFLSARR